MSPIAVGLTVQQREAYAKSQELYETGDKGGETELNGFASFREDLYQGVDFDTTQRAKLDVHAYEETPLAVKQPPKQNATPKTVKAQVEGGLS